MPSKFLPDSCPSWRPAMKEQPWIHTSAGMTIKVGLLHIGDNMNSGSEIQTKSGFVSAEQQLPG